MLTIQHIKTEAFNFFVDGNTILEEDKFLSEIKTKFDTSGLSKEQLKNILSQALASLENICASIGNGFYILIKPVSSYTQSIEIGGELAVLVADTINKAVRKLRNDESVILSDPLNISAEDIHSLVLLAQKTVDDYKGLPDGAVFNEDDDSDEEDDDEDEEDLIPPFMKG